MSDSGKCMVVIGIFIFILMLVAGAVQNQAGKSICGDIDVRECTSVIYEYQKNKGMK